MLLMHHLVHLLVQLLQFGGVKSNKQELLLVSKRCALQCHVCAGSGTDNDKADQAGSKFAWSR
jgi:hypothetical protein